MLYYCIESNRILNIGHNLELWTGLGPGLPG